MWPASCPARAAEIYACACSGSGTDVTHRFHSSPSLAAATSPSWCSRVIGSSRTPWPSRVTGAGAFIAAASAVVARHEDEALEEVHVLLVLEQRAGERWNGELLVLRAQRFGRDLLGHEQLQPVEQFGRRW